MVRHVTKITSLSRSEVKQVLALAGSMKARPADFGRDLERKSLLMLFEKPSLRTRVSLEVGMTQLGGHAIPYMTGDSPIGKKETYEDTAAVLSRMADAVTARVKSRDQVVGLARTATIPIINALDDFAHPMQMLADMLTMAEHCRGSFDADLDGLVVAFVGDLENNVTYDLMRSAALMGMTIHLAGPPSCTIEAEVLAECADLAPDAVQRFETAEAAVAGADVVYADSWMSYGIDAQARAARFDALLPFQVTTDLMRLAKPGAKFMNCLPAMRGEEQTADVIDGPQSIVFDQAENRLHAQKALLSLLIHGTVA